MALIIAAPIGVFTILALPMHEALRQRDIRVCGYAWAKCRTYDYSEAVRMTQIEGFRDRDGKLSRRAGIVVDFADGRRWSSADTGDFRDSVDPELAAFLADRTCLPLEQAQTEVDIPKADSKAAQSPGSRRGDKSVVGETLGLEKPNCGAGRENPSPPAGGIRDNRDLTVRDKVERPVIPT